VDAEPSAVVTFFADSRRPRLLGADRRHHETRDTEPRLHHPVTLSSSPICHRLSRVCASRRSFVAGQSDSCCWLLRWWASPWAPNPHLPFLRWPQEPLGPWTSGDSYDLIQNTSHPCSCIGPEKMTPCFTIRSLTFPVIFRLVYVCCNSIRNPP
jgi:hypothetical protein